MMYIMSYKRTYDISVFIYYSTVLGLWDSMCRLGESEVMDAIEITDMPRGHITSANITSAPAMSLSGKGVTPELNKQSEDLLHPVTKSPIANAIFPNVTQFMAKKVLNKLKKPVWWFELL